MLWSWVLQYIFRNLQMPTWIFWSSMRTYGLPRTLQRTWTLSIYA